MKEFPIISFFNGFIYNVAENEHVERVVFLSKKGGGFLRKVVYEICIE